MNQSSLVEKFLKFESNNALFCKSLKDVKFWHLIRLNLFNIITQDMIQTNIAHTKLDILPRVFRKIKQIPNFIFKNPLMKFGKIDILVLNHQRRVKNNGYFECLYTDKVLESISFSHLTIEEPYLEKHYKPINNSRVVYSDWINFDYSIVYLLLKVVARRPIPQEITSIYVNFRNEFETKITLEQFYGLILKSITIHKRLKSLYRKVLKNTRPKVILEVVSYTASRFAINEIAKEMGIPTVELQHGVMGPNNIAYNFVGDVELKTFPDYVYLFGDYWKTNTSFPIHDDFIRVTGWPYFEDKSTQNPNNGSVDHFNILFVSQGTIGVELSKFAVELSNILPLEYKIIYKLHPGEYDRWTKEYPWLIGSKIQVIYNNKRDIHYYLSVSSVIVGVDSTTLFESLAYGHKIFVLQLKGYERFNDLIADNIFEIVRDVKSLKNRLINLDFKKNINEINLSYYWKSDSIKNIITELKNLMD